MSVRAPDPVTPAVASPVDPLAVLGQALLALRTSSDVATTCAIAGSCATRALEGAEYRILRVDPRSGAIQALDETGAGVAYLPEARGPIEWVLQREMPRFIELPSGAGVGDAGLWSGPVEALAAVPLFGGGTLHGILVVAFASPRRFLAAEQSMLQSIGDLLALAMDRAELQKAASHERRRAESLEHRLHEDEEASSHLMSVVAHEIRSPLTAIKAYAEALLDSLSDPRAPRDRFLGIIGDECDRLALLVTDILELSRLEAGTRPLRLARFSLQDVVTETVEALAPLARAYRVAFDLDVESGMVIEADPDLMRRTLQNLISNAIRYSPAGGRVVFQARTAGAEWAGTVEDQGPTVPAQDLPRVFDRFYRARAGESGENARGLGLAIVRGIVELHGGQIWAESPESSGTRLCFTMPLRQLVPARARRIARELASRPDVVGLLEQTMELVATAAEAKIVSLAVVDPDHGDLVVRAARGLEDRQLVGRRTSMRSGVSGSVAAWGRPLLVRNIETDRRFQRLSNPQYATKSLLCVPLKVDGEVLGVFNVTNKESGQTFDDDDLTLVAALVDRVGHALERAWEHPGCDRVIEQACAAVRNIMRFRQDARLGDRDTIRLSKALGRELGLDDPELDLLGYVAGIHDVGMLPFLESVAAPGSLDPDRREWLTRHPEVSVEIIRPLEYMQRVKELILTHHERWDGAGYPLGLAGETIPLGSRILAVVDAYVSMIKDRPYRAPRLRDEALAELRLAAGTQFDPRVVDAFAAVLAREAA
jgi:signal transduction histidine kinase